jgi:hypothetical protein
MKNKLLFFIILSIGIGLRLYPALKQPLWLDEIYSLYFANNFLPLKLIFNLPETHPGTYYLLLKALLNFSTNPFFLRTISSIIPALIGCYLLYRQTHQKFLITILLLNPFFIHMSWQLRMYGLTFMFAVMLINLFQTPSSVNPKKLLALSLISTLFSFSLIIPIFCLYLYLYLRQRKITNFIPFLLVPLEFFLIKGFSTYKDYAEYASWITPPSILNIPSTILTTLGLATDINNLSSLILFMALLFYIVFIPTTYFLSIRNKLFFYAFTLPLLITIFISISFPFLSQHLFFYLFIPKISLFIPRFLLPLSVYFYIFLCKSIQKKYQLPILIILIIFWFTPNLKLNLHPFYASASPLNLSSDTLVMPPWENLRLNSNFSQQDLNIISHNYNTALFIESSLTKKYQDPDCSALTQFKKITYIVDPSIIRLSDYHQKIRTLLQQCSIAPLENQSLLH